MTFTEWYKETHHDDWHEDYAGLYGFAVEMSDKYEKWCKDNKIEPVFNG